LRSHFGMFMIGETQADVDEIADEYAARAKTTREEWLRARPHLPIGTPDRIVERIRRYAALGVSYLIPVFPYGRDRESVRLFSRDVIPELRSA
ncbi:MAG: hypothetical protein AAB284_00310, partial [Chloroflexota bacterium]